MRRPRLSSGFLIGLTLAFPAHGQEAEAVKAPPAETSAASPAKSLVPVTSRARRGRLRIEAFAREKTGLVSLADCGRKAPGACLATEAVVVDGTGEGSCIGKAVPTRRFVIGAGTPFPGVPVRMRVRSEGTEPIDYPAVVRLPNTAPQLICVDQNPLFDEAPLEVAISPFLSSAATGKNPGDLHGALMGIGMLGALFTNRRDTAKLASFERTLDAPDFAGGMDHDPIFGQSTTSLVKLSVASHGGAVPIFRGRERVGTTSDSFYIAANALNEIVVGPLGHGKPLKRCEKSDPKAYSFSC